MTIAERAGDVARAVTVTFRGLSNRHPPSHSHGTRITAMTKRNLAKDDQGPQRSFGLIVRRRHTRIIQKDKPLVLMLQNSLLLIVGELVLAFQFQFELHLIQFALQPLVATRFNSTIKAFYQRLLALRKLEKVTLTAAMRKLVTILNTRVRTDQLWRESAIG